MIILTIVASFLVCLVLFAMIFTLVGLRRRRMASGAPRPTGRSRN
jgi:heme/copper-type cytochrome/quinol oxidase subunit 2